MSEREPEDYKGLADRVHGEADRLERESEDLEQEIGDVRQEWERKRGDERVPGAPPRQDADRDAPGDEVGPEDAGRQEDESPDTQGS